MCRAAGKRLPTEQEWEWVARGGPKGNRFPWGGGRPINQLCWNGEGNDAGAGRRRSTCAVGSFASEADPFGIQDLAGNVYEWTSNRFAGEATDYVSRGGGWRSDEPDWVSVEDRAKNAASDSFDSLGVRCVMDAP